MRSLRILTCDGIRCAAAVLLGFSACSRAADWTQWRGPLHNNVAPEGEQAATKWSASQNVRWKAQVPGRGHSTPVIAGDLIVLTTADERSQAQGFVAYRRSTGEQLWLAGISQGGFPKIHVKNTHASSTPAWADGLFFATFCHHGHIEAAAVTAQGKVRWKKNIGPFSPRAYEYGYGASPTVYGDTLIVTAECDTSSWMKALDVKTGRVLWQQRRPQSLNWASPIVAELGGREQLVISGGHMIAAYDPASGQPLWTARCMPKQPLWRRTGQGGCCGPTASNATNSRCSATTAMCTLWPTAASLTAGMFVPGGKCGKNVWPDPCLLRPFWWETRFMHRTKRERRSSSRRRLSVSASSPAINWDRKASMD